MSKYLDLQGLEYFYTKLGTVFLKKSGAGEEGTLDWARISQKPSSIEGYGITDAYTKTETESFFKYTNSTPIVSALGGIGVGQTFNAENITSVLDKLLYPYVKPTASISVLPNGGTYEKGLTVTITALDVVATKKSRDITKVEAKNGQTVINTVTEGVTAGGTFSLLPAEGLTVNTDTIFTGVVTDADNGSVSANSSKFTFVDPYFQGTIPAGTQVTSDVVLGLNKVVQSKGSKTFSYTTNNSCMVIAYPKAYGTLKSALDPNKFENIASYTRSEVNVVCTSGTVAYYVYVKEPSTATAFSITYSY